MDEFGTILESEEAVKYLERTEKPNFETAFRFAGGDEPELIKLIDNAADNIELALSKAHRFTESEKLQNAVRRLGEDAKQLLKIFEEIRIDICED